MPVDEITPEAVKRGKAPNYGRYGKRLDGSPKGVGFFGELETPGQPGSYSTELSTEDEIIEGQTISYPLLVPTLTRKEINLILDPKKSFSPEHRAAVDVIFQKAAAHARERVKKGQSPYAEPHELYDLPE